MGPLALQADEIAPLDPAEVGIDQSRVWVGILGQEFHILDAYLTVWPTN